jgi:hypothetical protein
MELYGDNITGISESQFYAFSQIECYRTGIVPSKENVTEEAMSETEPMNVNERRKYLHKMRIRYWQAESKRAKSALLDEMQNITNLHRKSVIRLIKGDLTRKPRRKQRSQTYGAGVKSVMEKIAYSLDYPCAERLQPNLVWMAKHLEAHQEIELNAEVKTRLATISVSTVRRLLPPSQRAVGPMAHSKRQPKGNYAQRQAIPMRRIPWQESTPGHFEVDLVHHCGLSASGQYVHTLQMTDVATGWSECVAILGRSYLVMQDGFQRIEKRLPFPILEVHPDNGSEFLNDHLVRFWKERAPSLELSRSRPYFKNDNRFVEENNFSQVRAYVGYTRLDTVAQTNCLNQLYDQLWLYHNFFQPVMRLNEKHFQDGHVKRMYDPALPPLDRLCRTQKLTLPKQAQLQALRRSINPLQLRKNIQDLIDKIFALSCAAAQDSPEDVFLTLFSQEVAIPQ